MKFKYSILYLIVVLFFSCSEDHEVYLCTPCDLSCDYISFSEPGTCPHCGMELIKASEETHEILALNEINIQTGSGAFLLKGGKGNKDKVIRVFYHKPLNYQYDSRVLLVIPGSGRNADDYRDSWVEQSEKYSLLILSPMYQEIDYGFEDYHLGGLIKESNLDESITFVEGTNKARLDEGKFNYQINPNREYWLFNDFDRIFDLAVEAVGSTQTTYDIFGHSAGGHILHRMGLFYSGDKVNRILASNASFYTLPTRNYRYPFGIGNLSETKIDLERSFHQNLTVFLGEEDNAEETGGTFLTSESANKQGAHRFERGTFFYRASKIMFL